MEICFAVFEDDGFGLPKYMVGVFDNLEKAVEAGKMNIGTPILTHDNGEFMSYDDIEEQLNELCTSVVVLGDNGLFFHIIKTKVNSIREEETETKD
ncbi:MAG: hypothetical protein ABJH04_07910 [Cyclobacteriaceae bacterium]